MSTLRSGPRRPRSPGPRAPSRARLYGNFRRKRQYVFAPLRIGVLFCMHMTAGPDFTGLCLIGGAAEEEVFQCGSVKGEEGPEVTEACEGWCGNHGE